MEREFKPAEIIEKIQKYAHYYKNGAMDISLAKALAQPYIDKYNKIARDVAKKQKCKAREIDFSYFMR